MCGEVIAMPDWKTAWYPKKVPGSFHSEKEKGTVNDTPPQLRALRPQKKRRQNGKKSATLIENVRKGVNYSVQN